MNFWKGVLFEVQLYQGDHLRLFVISFIMVKICLRRFFNVSSFMKSSVGHSGYKRNMVLFP